MRIAVIGHGRSPEGRAWGAKIDACDVIVRMWDWHWQGAGDYGARCDYALLELAPAQMAPFYQHKRREPAKGWLASALWQWEKCKRPPGTEIIHQRKWTSRAMKMGGLGQTGQLEFTRGTIAACWAIEHCSDGDEVVLVGFDNVDIGRTLPIEEGFPPAYCKEPSTFTFQGYLPGRTKNGNHDFGIEAPFIRTLAKERGVIVSMAHEVWRAVGPTAMVLGDAACVNDDAAAALAMFAPDAICATNNIGIDWPTRLDYWCTLHPNKCPDWIGIVAALEKRRAAGRNRPQIWGHKPAPGIDRSTEDWHGSTGLLCVKVLIEEGFQRIVLAGVPMSAEGGHYYSSRAWLQADRYREGWTRHHKKLKPFVRSMSGWTQKQLGAPTPQWIAG